MKSTQTFKLRPDGRVSYVEETPLFSGQVGTAEYQLIAEDVGRSTFLPTDTVMIVLERDDGKSVNQIMLMDIDGTWVHVSNGWETDHEGMLKVSFLCLRKSGTQSTARQIAATEQTSLVVNSSKGYTPLEIFPHDIDALYDTIDTYQNTVVSTVNEYKETTTTLVQASTKLAERALEAVTPIKMTANAVATTQPSTDDATASATVAAKQTGDGKYEYAFDFAFGLKQGDVGGKGDAATIAVGETITGTAGSKALVENKGTSSDAVLKFTIPEGKRGPVGESLSVYAFELEDGRLVLYKEDKAAIDTHYAIDTFGNMKITLN